MTEHVRDRIVIEESLVKSIGRITVYFSMLEELIKNCVNILIGGEGASIVTARGKFPDLLNLLSSLYRQKLDINLDKDSPDNLRELLKAAETAEKQRNDVIHSIWNIRVEDVGKPFTRIKHKVSKRKGLKIDVQQMNVLELNVILLMIKDAIDKARKFTRELLMSYITLLISPADGAVFSRERPEFTWLSVKGAIGYELALTTKYPDIDYSISKMGANLIRNTQYECETPLQRNTTYYWMIRPVIATVSGYWSEVRRFTIE